MAFGPYTQPVAPAKWVDPLDLNMYAKGMAYKQDLAEKNLKSLTDAYNTITSLPAYGPDKQKLAEIDQQFRQQVSSMNISNLGDMGAVSQIRGLIGQYSTNPDVLAIAQRGSTYQSMLKEKDDADKKNKIYVNRGMNKLSKYFSGDEYIQNLKFGNDGYTAPDAAEIMESVKKFVTPDEKVETLPNGLYRIVKSYDSEKLDNAFKMVTSSNPNWQKYHRDQLEDSLEGKNIDDYAKQYYSNIVTESDSIIEKLNTLKSQTRDPKNIAYYDNLIATTQKSINETNKKLQNPYLGTSFKDELLQKSMNDDIKNMSEAIQFHADGEMKMDEKTRLNIQLGNQLIEKQAADISLGASLMGKTLSEVMSNPSLLSSAVTLGQQAKLAEFSQKEGIKLQNKIAAKNDAVHGGFGKFTDSDTVTYTDEKGDNKTLQYGEFKKTIKEASTNDVKAMVASVLNKKNQGDPQWQPITADDVKVTGTGEKRKFKINGFFGFGGDAVRYDEVIDISTFEGTSSGGEVDTSNPLISGEVDTSNPLLK